MTSLLLWTGPVQALDLRSVVWRSPVDLLVISHGPSGGYGSSSFSDLARVSTDSAGHILPMLLAHGHVDLSAYDHVAVAGFSAAHGLMAPLLLADGDRFEAAVCLDACFSDPARLVKPGYASFGARAARGEKLFVMTASAGGGRGSGATIGPGVPDFSTGDDCVLATFNTALQIAGVSPSISAAEPPVGLPSFTDVHAAFEQAGSFFLLDYARTFQHAQHVHVLAKPVFETFLAPLFAGQKSAGAGAAPAGTDSSWAPKIFAVGAVGTLLWTLYKARKS